MTPSPSSRRLRPFPLSCRAIVVIVAFTVLVVLVGVGTARLVVASRSTSVDTPAVGGSCTTTPGADGAVFTLDLDQAANATTVAAVGKRLGLPDHAITIALATGLQESQLHNLDHGDRDSLGIFQQRPSQGWGTAEQVSDANYASQAFYEHLAKVPTWRTMAVTDAAQAVQFSAAPKAYAPWEPEARELAIALTGEVPAGFACRITSAPSDVTPDAGGAAKTMRAELGAPGLDEAVAPARGWTMAAWLVGHALQHHLGRVSFAGQTWTPASGAWTADAGASTDHVTVI